MTTTTLFIDSRTKISGTHADFRVSLPEQVTLRGARMRLDSIRTTDTITTVSVRNKYAYFLNGTGGLTSVALSEAAYTGSTFAAQLATKSGRASTYLSATNSLQVAYAEATRIIWEDEELQSFPASSFPAGASPTNTEHQRYSRQHGDNQRFDDHVCFHHHGAAAGRLPLLPPPHGARVLDA